MSSDRDANSDEVYTLTFSFRSPSVILLSDSLTFIRLSTTRICTSRDMSTYMTVNTSMSARNVSYAWASLAM